VALAETLAVCSEVAAGERKVRGGGFANYFSKALRGKLDEMRLARIKAGHEEQASHMKLGALGTAIAANQARRTERTAAAPKVTDPIEAARTQGANSMVLDKFCRPMLLRFTNVKQPAEWRCLMADMLADMPEEVLVWAAKHIRDKCPDPFVPTPAVLKGGMDAYLERKANRGAKFRPDSVFPDWAPSSQRERLRAYAEECEEDQEERRQQNGAEEGP
jgi:hypothetical protein